MVVVVVDMELFVEINLLLPVVHLVILTDCIGIPLGIHPLTLLHQIHLTHSFRFPTRQMEIQFHSVGRISTIHVEEDLVDLVEVIVLWEIHQVIILL